MLYLIVLVLVAAALVGPGRAGGLGRVTARAFRARAPGPWRPGVGAIAMTCLIGALAAGVRGEWPLAAVALPIAVAAALIARRRAPKPGSSRPRPSRREAADLLGVEPDAGEAQIRAAYARLIRVAHPDRGGTAGLAAHLNAARDVLLGRN